MLGGDTLADVRTQRKAKKKDIQAWISAFEEREGRSPNASDKEAVRPMYREFKDLEARLAALVQGEENASDVPGPAASGPAADVGGGSGLAPDRESPAAADDVQNTVMGKGAGGDEDSLRILRADRNTKKREIKAWIQAFEEREGRSPTADEKLPIKGLYNDFKRLEKMFADAGAHKAPTGTSIVTGDDPFVASENAATSVEDVKAEKKRVKREIQAWLDDFETREGRPALQQDKVAIRALYKRHKDLERELERLADEGGTQALSLNLSETNDRPSDRHDQGDDPSAAEPVLLGPSSSTGASTSAQATQVHPKRVQRHVTQGRTDRSASDGESDGNNPGDTPKEISVHYAGHQDTVGGGRRESTPDASAAGSPLASPSPDRSPMRDAHRDLPDEAPIRGSTSKSDRGSMTFAFPGGDGGEEQEKDGEQLLHEAPDVSMEQTPEQKCGGIADDDGEVKAFDTRGATLVYSLRPDAATPNDNDERGHDSNAPGAARSEDTVHEGGTEKNSKQGQASDAHAVEAAFLAGTSSDGPPLDERREDNIPMAAQDARVRRMRARFLKMREAIDDEEGELLSSPSVEAVDVEMNDESNVSAPLAQGPQGARSRWAILGDAVAPNRLSRSPRARPEGSPTDIMRASSPTGDQLQEVQEQNTTPAAPSADDGVSGPWLIGQMSNLLTSDAPPPPPPPPSGLERLEAEASRLRGAVEPPPPEYVAEYQAGVRGAELVVASVGVEEVEARERDLELERLADAREETNIYRAREANLLYRENRARERVSTIAAAKERDAKAQQQAVIEISIARERALAPAFARARAGLEAAIRAQEGRVRELFGELRPGETAGARRFRVDWRGVPQPVEIRLHCIRAVRDRLPRGSYVMLSSMAERLGGRVMRWSKGHHFDDFDDEDSIDTEGGDTRPAASLPVQHGGRYYDRELRFDQNVYQLCPSKVHVRPGNVMVFELFRLAGSGVSGGTGGTGCGSSRHKGGELDEDTAVGWCVLPLADSRLRVVRGSFRIPMLRGEPNPNIDLHEGLENLIAADLEAWLGNLYLDIRHLQREARLEAPGAEGGSSIGGEGFDVEYDHVRKVVRLGKGLLGNVASSAGRWRRWRGNNDAVMHATDDEGDRVQSPGTPDACGTVDGVVDVEAGESSKMVRGRTKKVAEVKDYMSHDEDPEPERTSADQAKVDDTHARSSPQANTVSGTDDLAAVSRKKRGWTSVLFGGKERSPDGLPTMTSPARDATRSKIARGSFRDRRRRATETARAERENNGTPPVDTPPPEGSWASAQTPAQGVTGIDKVDVDNTIDEECLSDDDMHRGSEFHFTPSGEAALAVDTAAGAVASDGGNRRGIGLRRRGEGARWDHAALGNGHKGLPRRYGGGSTAARDSHVWTPLTNTAEMEFYRFAVAADPGTDGPPTPAQIIRHKLRYIRQEVLLDLHPRGWRVVEYWLAVMVFVGALWLRVYLHALGQWCMLYSLGVPVFSFSPRLWEFAIKYMDRSSSLGVEVAFVWWGPVFVTLCFATLAGLARLWGMAACGGKGAGGGEGLPASVSRFVAALGVSAAVDPYLLFLVDLMAGNHHCVERCVDYSSPTCRCHEGDAWKLYERLEEDEGAGVTGALLTILIYAMVSIITALILHQYLLHAHMNGRMRDVWRRLNAGEADFFIPYDLEVSMAELQHAIMRARRWRGAGGTKREVVLHDFHANEETTGEASTGVDARGKNRGDDDTSQDRAAPSLWTRRKKADTSPAVKFGGRARQTSTTHVAIYEVTVEGKKSLHRQFLQTSDGTIMEVFGEPGRGVGWLLRSSLNALMQEELGGGRSTGAVRKEEGIFAGMLPAADVCAS